MSDRSANQQKFSFAQGENAAYLENLYEQYRQNPDSLDQTWQQFFAGYEFARFGALDGADTGSAEDARNEAKVEAYVYAYRRLGHLRAHLDPLHEKPELGTTLLPEAHGLKNIDPSRKFHPVNLPQRDPMTLPEIMDLLQATYCGRIGADFREMNDIEAVTWFQEQMEGCRNQPVFTSAVKQRVLEKLAAAEGFERFLQMRYLGQKRFSLEGAEALIPMLDTMFDDASLSGVIEVCFGMAHRGRLNVLANVMEKKFEQIVTEFEGSEVRQFDIDGDVKYHQGFASEVKTQSGNPLRLYLSPNPSHLEAVDPVVEGFSRARQRLLQDKERKQVLPLLIHGDAAFIGQGIVLETFNLSQLENYKTGGTIHIIINNQIGFTTDPDDSRSCTYSSDVAKVIRAPVLHVNADDPEAVIWTAKLALAYRQKFQRDIVVDLVGYRRHGHNETDEPGFTQPVMYKLINDHPSVFSLYAKRLEGEGVANSDSAKQLEKAYRDRFQKAFEDVRAGKYIAAEKVFPSALAPTLKYRRASEEEIEKSVNTSLKESNLRELGEALTAIPKGFTPHAKIVRLLETRREMTKGKGAVDWPFAELLAFGSLAVENHHVRLSGQDCRRGTFSSRHAVLRDYNNNERFCSLNHLKSNQASVDIIDSPLSEAGVMGFEFGYAVADPESLILWEGQFGDFVNGAQIVIDQFLVASEAKWKQTCGLVLLLPHGYEGQGPEHSSARLERFLQLSGNLNIQVASPTTPAQYFHILRRQIHRDFRKPLVLMTPKSLLRHPKVISPLADFAIGGFQEVIDDKTMTDRKSIERVIACTGKIYYEIGEARAANPAYANTAVIRVEQLHPFPGKMLKKILSTFPKMHELIWTQEEPFNMGAWTYIQPRLTEILDAHQKVTYVGRVGSGTPAEGSAKAHIKEQQRIIHESLGLACHWTPATLPAVAK